MIKGSQKIDKQSVTYYFNGLLHSNPLVSFVKRKRIQCDVIVARSSVRFLIGEMGSSFLQLEQVLRLHKYQFQQLTSVSLLLQISFFKTKAKMKSA